MAVHTKANTVNFSSHSTEYLQIVPWNVAGMVTVTQLEAVPVKWGGLEQVVVKQHVLWIV